MSRKTLLMFGLMLGSFAFTLGAQEKKQTPPRRVAVRAGRLIDGKGDKPVDNAVVLIEDDKIVSVTPGGAAPAGGALIDLSKATVLPGFVEVHTHGLLNGDMTAEDYDAQLLKEAIPSGSILGQRKGAMVVENGFPTHRD